MKQLTSVLLLWSLCFSSFVFAQDKYPVKNTSVEGITEYELENGLKVLLFPDLSKQTITVNITYLVGSRHEGYGETGMAHLLEHLVFKGTPNHPDIPKELSDHGAQPNGTTWYDRTNYFETFAATDENLKWALDLESDRMINSYIAAKDLESEMTVVRNEFESGENFPQAVLFKRVSRAAYSWHNYGNSTIGARADIENVPIDRLQAFYRKYYQPDNAVLMVAGKIDEEETLKLIQEYFGKIPRPERELIPTYTEDPIQDGERLVTLKRTGDVQVLAALYHICSGFHPDNPALQVLMQALTSQPSGRLHRNLVESKKASSQYGYIRSLKEPGFAYFAANVLKEKSLDDVQQTLIATIDSLADHPLDETEVSRAKSELLKRIELAMTNTTNVGLTMSEYIAMGDWRLFFLERDRMEAVTVEDVNRVAKYYFKESNRTVGKFIPDENPERVEIPKAEDVASLVKDYKGRVAMDQGEAFDPSPANIESRTNKGTLANGMRYSLLSKQTKGDVVEAQIGIRFGNEKTLFGKQTVSSITASMLDKGTTSMTRQEIKDFLDARKARLNVYGGSGRQFLRIQTTRENLNDVLGLAFDLLQNPSFPQNEFETLIQQQIAGIEQGKSEPTSKASLRIAKYMSPHPKGHINYVSTPEEDVEDLKTLTLDDVKAFYNEFYGAGKNSTITIVGDFDEASAKEVVEKKLGSWKKGKPYARPKATVFEGKAINEDIITPDKTNAFFLVQYEFKMRDDSPEYPALYVANYLMGGGFLNSRLATRIRQKDGLSYGVGSFLNADGLEESASFGSYAIYNPANKENLEKAFFEEINRVLKEGFTQEELDAAKKGILQSNLVNRAQDGSLLTILNNNMMFDRDMKHYSDMDQAIQDLTLDNINSAFRKYIDPDKFCVVKAGDFK